MLTSLWSCLFLFSIFENPLHIIHCNTVTFQKYFTQSVYWFDLWCHIVLPKSFKILLCIRFWISCLGLKPQNPIQGYKTQDRKKPGWKHLMKLPLFPKLLSIFLSESLWRFYHKMILMFIWKKNLNPERRKWIVITPIKYIPNLNRIYDKDGISNLYRAGTTGYLSSRK